MAPSDSEHPTKRIRTIFTEARQIPPGPDRTEFLEEVCGDDEALLQKVLALLEAEDKADSFLQDYVNVPAVESPGAMIGEKIDNYLIIEHLGEGGFADVYRVEQTEPIRRQLAMKIIKPGMGSREIIARFNRERDALALMDHPNIAHIHDAGTTADGRSFFVMDLACGAPITQYCDDKHLSQDERLQLFRTVCSAVQHAHQKGILHRDLKPSNIVVIEKDDEAVPMVIDFGIAKTLRGGIQAQPLLTQIGSFLGTPAYMSPEQISGSSENIDTRSDVYSLGILLYELITGVKPFDQETLQRAALAEVQRIICEDYPDKPSTKIRKIGKAAKEIAKRRSRDTATLVRTLKGDLDWIVMKAIEKDRNRRYQGAGELDKDIERHLQNRPIEAGAPGKIYRLRKLIHRHVFVSGITAIVIPVFLTGFILTVIGFSQARKERDKALIAELVAEVEAAQALTYKTLLLPYLRQSRDEWGQPEILTDTESQATGSSSKNLRYVLNALSERVDNELHGQPELERNVRKLLAESYLNVGMYRDAWQELEKRVNLFRELYGPNSIEYADSLAYYACAIDSQGQIIPPDLVDVQIPRRINNPIGLRLKALGMCKEAIKIYRSNDHKVGFYVKMLAFLSSRLPFADKEHVMREYMSYVDNSGDPTNIGGIGNFAQYLKLSGREDEARALYKRMESVARAYDEGPYKWSNTPYKALWHTTSSSSKAEELSRKNIEHIENKVRGKFSKEYENALKGMDRYLTNAGRPDPEIRNKLAMIEYHRAFDPVKSCVDYDIFITEPGTYRLYVRWDGNNIWSDSLIVRLKGVVKDGLGGSVSDYYGFTRREFPPDADFSTTPVWQHKAGFETLLTGKQMVRENSGKLKFVDGQPFVSAEWTIEKSGIYTLQFMEVDTGVAIDAFVLQLSRLPFSQEQDLIGDSPGSNGVYEAIDGSVVVEAENYTRCYDGVGSSWTFVPVEVDHSPQFLNFGGRGYLQLLPDPFWIDPGKFVQERSVKFTYEGHWNTSLAYFDEAVRLDPSHLHLQQRGWMHEAAGNYELAVNDYTQALNTCETLFPLYGTPVIVMTRYRRLSCWLQTGQYDSIIEDWENPIYTGRPQLRIFQEMRNIAAQAYMKMGLMEKYEECIKSTIFPRK